MVCTRHFVSFLALLILATSPLAIRQAVAAENPVPFVNQPLVPSSVAPGSAGFTLTVNGAGFRSTSVVNWNGSPLPTIFVSVDTLQATVPASDVAAAGTASVTVSSPAPGGGTSSPALFSITSPTTSVNFAISKRAIPAEPQGIVAADFNGDGIADLAIVSQKGTAPTCYNGNTYGTISILLGNGKGAFTQKSKLCFPYTIMGVPAPQLIAGDFNNDGKIDILAGYDLGGGESFVSFLGSGDGTFTTGPTAQAGDGFGAVLSADFNGDGALDLAFDANFTGPILLRTLLGTGDGEFTSGQGYSGVLGSYGGLATADFNNDGILDLAFGANLQGSSSQLTIFLGNGDGSFSPAPTQPSVSEGGPVTTGDFNGDGIPDLIAGGQILFGDGNGNFTPGPTPPPCAPTATADLNGDGILDLVCLGSTSVSMALGNGDGTFQPVITENVGNFPYGVAIADFNGDGRLDLAVTKLADTTISILRQTVAAPKVSVALTANPNPSSVGQSVTLTANVTASPFAITGTITFKKGSNILGSAPLVNGQASINTSFPKAGTFSIVASYSGDQNYNKKNSNIVKQVVNP